MGRQAKGVRLIRLEEDRRLAAIAVFQGGDSENPDSIDLDSANLDSANLDSANLDSKNQDSDGSARSARSGVQTVAASRMRKEVAEEEEELDEADEGE